MSFLFSEFSQVNILLELLLITDYFEKITIEYLLVPSTVEKSKEDRRTPEFNLTCALKVDLITYLLLLFFLQLHRSITRNLSRMIPQFRCVLYLHHMYPIMDLANRSYTTGWVVEPTARGHLAGHWGSRR